MSIFGAIGSLIGGNEAADAQADALRAARVQAEKVYKDTSGAVSPYTALGSEALGMYGDLLRSPGEVDPVSQAILDRSQADVYNTMRARGLGDSGAGWRTLLDTAYRGRQDARARRFQELLGGVGLGQWGIGTKAGAGQNFTNQYFNAQQGIGQAKAAGKANMWTQLGSLGDQAAAAIAGAFGGAGGGTGMDTGMTGTIDGGGGFSLGSFASKLFE